MTYKQFLAKLKNTPREWRLRTDLDIPGMSSLKLRLDAGIPGVHRLLCPVTAVAGNRRSPTFWRLDIDDLGMDSRVLQQIVTAADGQKGRMRDDLLAACDVSEQP